MDECNDGPINRDLKSVIGDLKSQLDNKRDSELQIEEYKLSLLDSVYFAHHHHTYGMCRGGNRQEVLALYSSATGIRFLHLSSVFIFSPVIDMYPDFAQKVAEFTHAIRRCKLFIKKYQSKKRESFRQFMTRVQPERARELAYTIYDMIQDPRFLQTLGTRSFVIGEEELEELKARGLWKDISIMP